MTQLSFFEQTFSQTTNHQPPTGILTISLWQPWAFLWATGEKRFETRHWRFPDKYKGQRCRIHAATKWDTTLELYCQEEPFRSALLKYPDVLGLDTPETPGMRYRRVNLGNGEHIKLPLFGIIGEVELLDHVEAKTALQSLDSKQAIERESCFGDFSAGRFAWIATNHKLLETFIPCGGQQGFWKT